MKFCKFSEAAELILQGTDYFTISPHIMKEALQIKIIAAHIEALMSI